MRRIPQALLGLIGDALQKLGAPQPGVDFVHLTRLASRIPRGSTLTVDFTTTRSIGTPIVILQHTPRDNAAPARFGLTRREAEVANLVACGDPNKVIARKLGLSVGTVKDHVHQILAKSGLRNRTALAASIRTGEA